MINTRLQQKSVRIITYIHEKGPSASLLTLWSTSDIFPVVQYRYPSQSGLYYLRFPQTIDLAPCMSIIHHQLRCEKTRGPDVAASVSRLTYMRRHDNAQSDTPQSNTECRTDITIRAWTVYTTNVTFVLILFVWKCVFIYWDQDDISTKFDIF